MKKLAFFIVFVVLVIGIIIWRSQPEKLSVWVSKAEYGAVEQTVSNTRAGTIKACRRSKLSMPLGGVVDKLLVKKGDHVKAEELLLELWSRDHHANVDQAIAAFEAAKHAQEQMCLMADRNNREAKRASTLLSKGLIAADVADNLQSNADVQNSACLSAKSQVGSAKAFVAMQKAVLERFQLRAPFDGIVAEINGEIGEYVTPSPPGVLTPPAIDLIDTSCLYASAPIDEVDAAELRLDMPVKITLDAFRNKSFNGKLTRIAPYVLDLEKQARTVDVDVRFNEVPEEITLLIGYSADVTIIIKSKERVLRIPTEALIDNNHVWVLNPDQDNKNGKLEKRELELGIGNYSFTEVKNGLNEGELVVRSPDQTGIAEGAEASARFE